MNNYSKADFNSQPSKHRKTRWKKRNAFKFAASKRKSWGNSMPAEYFPLVSADCSDSDEELTLHDVQYLNVRQRGSTKSLSEDVENVNNHTVQEGSKSDPFLQCDFLPLELKKGDTLQSISVKYNCPISDLKRANNLISNQEFYGLRQVKIPVRKHGLLSEMLKDTQNAETVPTEEETTSNEVKTTSNEVKTISIGIGPMLSNSTPQEAAEFLRKMDEDLMKIMLNTKTKKDSLEEVTAILNAPTIQPLIESSKTTNHDIRFHYVIVCMLIFAIVIPIVIVIYMYHMKPSFSLAMNSSHVLSEKVDKHR